MGWGSVIVGLCGPGEGLWKSFMGCLWRILNEKWHKLIYIHRGWSVIDWKQGVIAGGSVRSVGLGGSNQILQEFSRVRGLLIQ